MNIPVNAARGSSNPASGKNDSAERKITVVHQLNFDPASETAAASSIRRRAVPADVANGRCMNDLNLHAISGASTHPSKVRTRAATA
ncbi:MAG: hypothetical protein DMG65_03915 [Candidatus Angelobacter sp. Gp1-AA117]|nr:MAG: hypothetical protein DMG65_03915 [Candidatus Angelobacter sp. Gp1-AA117]